MLLDGDGVRLRAPDGGLDHRLDQRWQPLAFAGEVAVDCSLLGGTSTDFNLMLRRGPLAGRGAGGARPTPARQHARGPVPGARGPLESG